MSEPRQCVVDILRRPAVYGQQVVVWVELVDIACHLYPLVVMARLDEVPFIGDRPPHIAVCRQAGDGIAYIAHVVLHCHAVESP